MIEIYMLVYAVAGQPKVEVYPSEQAACVAFQVHRDAGSRVYKIDGKRDSPGVAEGDCKPVQQFVIQK